jgi:myosin heavy subunit
MKNPHFGYDKRSTGGDFLIDHFAGDVVYSCRKFLDKNRDTLSPGALALLRAGSAPCGALWCR